MSAPPAAFPYRWRSRKTHADRFGDVCRIVPRLQTRYRADGTVCGWGYGTSNNSTLVEFEDGEQVITTRGSIRRRGR